MYLRYLRYGLLVAMTVWIFAVSWSPQPPQLFGLRYYTWGFVEGFAKVLATMVFVGALVGYRARPLRARLKSSVRLTAIVVGLWLVIGNADVAFNSALANKLCLGEGGMHVYGHAEVEGFVGRSFEYWSKEGFKYTEVWNGKGQRIRVSNDAGGQIQVQIVDKFISRYEVTGDETVVYKRFPRNRRFVRDRSTGEKLAEYVNFKIYPGLYDRLIISLLPAASSPWTCTSGMYKAGRTKTDIPSNKVDVVSAALSPKK